ncbi:NAD/ferredoxin-dependent reductase-like protein [Actinomadura hallensis]|uniref:NAD/ferredoxin-dependent reductase-like protein n=1 Tax=Actinomadura hallensis TaxID=337895 RepID=A0A543I8M7_9ACTN|nr:FAD/NAD(P)-binding oxidoreductase [Actinomadura hallensis]TQM66964.1 NAD/ferredoxin-dependent reductase-like protein [Actinomadura hallensis]
MGRIVVAGASLGGLRAAEQLRAAGHTGEIVVVGDEPHPPYNRPPLSKEALATEISLDRVAFRMRPSVADVAWHLGTPVVRADLAARTVHLADGTEIRYDGLVVATGLRPRRLDAPGTGPSRHVVRTLDDAAALRERLRPGVRAAVVGAGFIGCEVAATARTLGADVTVVAPEEQPMLRPLGARLGAELRRRHEGRGVRFLLGRTVARFTGTGLELSDGTQVAAEVVVEAVGSVPCVEWLDGNGLDLSDGVLCDGALRVEGRPEVVAVGDVARFPNPRYDDVPRRVEHWSMPTDTARHAARTLLGQDAGPFMPLPSFWSDQYDLRLQSFGAPGLGDDVRVLEGDLGGEAVVGYHRDGRLVGVVMLGAARRQAHYRGLLLDDARVPAS